MGRSGLESSAHSRRANPRAWPGGGVQGGTGKERTRQHPSSPPQREAERRTSCRGRFCWKRGHTTDRFTVAAGMIQQRGEAGRGRGWREPRRKDGPVQGERQWGLARR